MINRLRTVYKLWIKISLYNKSDYKKPPCTPNASHPTPPCPPSRPSRRTTSSSRGQTPSKNTTNFTPRYLLPHTAHRKGCLRDCLPGQDDASALRGQGRQGHPEATGQEP